jgi:hypothetical protein
MNLAALCPDRALVLFSAYVLHVQLPSPIKAKNLHYVCAAMQGSGEMAHREM